MKKDAYWQGVDPLPGGNMAPGVAEASSLLADVLVCLRAQAWNYQTAHWQTAGVPSYGNHLLFDRLYKSVQGEIDTLAEKTIGYFGLHAVEPTGLADLTAKRVQDWVAFANCHVERGLHSEEQFQEGVSQAYRQIKQMGRMTLGLDDFLMSVASNHESHTYLLQQLLVDVNALNDRYKEMGMEPEKDMTMPYKTAALEEGDIWSAQRLADGSWLVEGEVDEEDFNSALQVIEADARSKLAFPVANSWGPFAGDDPLALDLAFDHLDLVMREIEEKTATPHGGWSNEMSSLEKSWGGYSSFSPIKRSEEDEHEDQIPGGLGDKAKREDFDKDQIDKGLKIEQEHTDDPAIALEISFDHLTEDPAYYDKLEKVEKHAAIGDKAAPSVEHLFRDDPKRYELTQFVKSKRDTNLDSDPATPPTPVEIKEQPGGKSLSTLHRYVIDTEQPDAKEAEGIDEHPTLSDFEDWTTVRE
jgi:DNA-binding ferritin-like protein